MRLLIIDKTAGLLSAHERHQALASLPDIDLHVFGPYRWIENGREVLWESRGDERYHCHPGSVWFPGYYARHVYWRSLFRVLRDVRPDIVQLLEEPWALVSGQTAFLRPLAGRFGLLFYTWENVYRPWKYPSRLSPLYTRIDRHVHGVSLGAVCATKAAEAVLLRKGYDKPTAVVPYGVCAEFFADHAPSRTPSGVFTVGYVGRLLEMKGVDLLVRALEQLPEARLVLIGSGQDEHALRELVTERQLESRVQFHNAIPEKQVVSHLASFDALVLPSRTTPGWSEQLGRVLIEAMALGVPAAGSSSGAIPEVLGREDLVFAEDNLDELVSVLKRVQSDDSWRQEVIEYGRHRAREHFSWENFAQRVGDFYRQLGLL
ncbi:MAG: glycosyltransferase [bacterium]